MPRTPLPYPPEFRRQMVDLVRSGRAIGELAREFECSDQTIRNGVRQAGLDDGRRDDGLTSAEREELRRLRCENRPLREERERLAKAAAWVARERGDLGARSACRRRHPGAADVQLLTHWQESPDRGNSLCFDVLIDK